MIREGGDSAQAGQGAGHGNAERGTGGDRGSAQGKTQGAGRSEGGSAGKVPRLAAVEGDRGRAADVTMRDKEHGQGKGTEKTRRGASRAPRRAATGRMEWSGALSASVGAAKGTDTGTGRILEPGVQARAQVTEGGTHGADRGTKAWGPGRDPRTRARALWAPGTGTTGHGSHRGRAERRESGRRQGAPKAGRAAGAVHPPRHPTIAGAPHPPPTPPPRPPLQHRP